MELSLETSQGRLALFLTETGAERSVPLIIVGLAVRSRYDPLSRWYQKHREAVAQGRKLRSFRI